MPAMASRAKAEATDGYGATVILHGHEMADTFARMEEIQQRDGLTLLHPFADPLVIAGQGTVGLEILEDLQDVDVVVAGSGGGGMLGGVAAAIRAARPGARVYGVEPLASNALAASASGPGRSMSEGVSSMTMSILSELVAEIRLLRTAMGRLANDEDR